MGLKSATKVDTNRVEFEVEVEAAEFEAAVNKAYKKNIRKMSVPGFRKGKAPRQLVEKMYGIGIFYDDAVNDLYPTALTEAIDSSEYEYIDDTVDMDVVSVGKEGLVFKAVVTVKPEVEVGEYKGLKADKKIEPVTDKDIDEQVLQLQQRNSRLVDVEGRKSQNDDTVTFDFEGFVDGQTFEGGKSDNHTLTLGSGQFIPGFEEQLVDRSIDDEFEVNVTFPEDYQAEELAGKPAVFKCKVHEIKAREMPELNDEFAKDVSEFDTLDLLKEDLKSKLLKQREQKSQDDFEFAIMNQLADALKAEIPEAMFENQVDQNVREFEQRLQSKGLGLEMYMNYTGMDEENFREGFREQAENQVKVRLALEKIAQIENIVPTDEETEERYKKLAEQYKIDVEKVKLFILKSELVKDMSVEKALEYVKENADITE